jgi:hypothetical protein
MSQSPSANARRRPEFVTLIAVYQFVTAGILFLLSCLILTVLFPSIFLYIDVSEGVFAAMIVAAGAMALLIGFGVASLVVGWGLLRMREWGRLGAIVLAAFALIGFPVWTIVAILVLVHLTSNDAREAFTRSSAKRTGSGDRDDLATQAAYKTEPAPDTSISPLEDTRPIGLVPANRFTSEGPATTQPEDETRQITPIPMPPPDEPLLETEADVTEHYEQWKAALPQEPGSDVIPAEQPTAEMEIVESTSTSDEPERRATRRWFVPPEEAGMDHRILEPFKHANEEENDGRDDPESRDKRE